MCGRFARIVSDKKLREKYRLKEIAHLDNRYNIAPTQPVAAVRATDGVRNLRKYVPVPGAASLEPFIAP